MKLENLEMHWKSLGKSQIITTKPEIKEISKRLNFNEKIDKILIKIKKSTKFKKKLNRN